MEKSEKNNEPLLRKQYTQSHTDGLAVVKPQDPATLGSKNILNKFKPNLIKRYLFIFQSLKKEHYSIYLLQSMLYLNHLSRKKYL